MEKPILCLDFDGVLHSYESGWKGADVIPDAAVPGAVEFLARAVNEFTVAIYSSRSGQDNGIMAMQFWLKLNLYRAMDQADADEILGQLQWPTEKPPALVTIDDRAITFTGEWPSISSLRGFKPWNKAIHQKADDGCCHCLHCRLMSEQQERERVGLGSLMKEAQAIVEQKFLFPKFIDGTPLANDIAVWMAEFAAQKLEEKH